MVPRQADADRVGNGDYIVSGLCPAESFTGNPVKVLSEYAPMRVSGRRNYPFRSRLAHATFTLEGLGSEDKVKVDIDCKKILDRRGLGKDQRAAKYL